MTLSAVVVGLFLVVYAALLVLGLRRPLLARLALREAVRRPGQSAVVVLGLMVGSVAIFSTQVLGDSFVESSTQSAYLAWGHVDLVAADGGRFFDPALASGLAADAGLRSSQAGVQAGVELPSSVVDVDRNNAKGLVMLVGFDPATQGPFGSYRLTDGKTTLGQDLGPNEVLISASLAGALEARTGDRLRVAVGQEQIVDLRVAGIAEAEGPGAYTLRPAVFSPLDNLRLLTASQGINVIRLAAPGEGRAELDRAHKLAPRVRAALQPLPGGARLNVREAKRDEVDFLVTRANQDGVIFSGLSLFVALAGAAVVVNLGLSLAEERRPRHAVLRALGLGRTGMMTLSVLEGALYSLAAAVAALVPGTVVGLVLARRFQGGGVLYSSALESHAGGPLLSPITLGAMALSIAIGALIVLATLFATSVRSSRMQISSAIKNLPEPAVRRTRSNWRTVLLAGLGLVSLAALVAGNISGRLAGGAGLVIIASALVGGRISDRLRATLTGAALTAWAAIVAGSITTFGATEFQLLGLGALVAVFGLSLMVASNLRVLEIPAGWLQGTVRATLRPSLAYLTRRPLRAGLGTAAFAVVLALITITSVLIPTFVGSIDPGTEYDIRVNAPTAPGLSLPDSVRPQILREIAMPTRPYRGEVRSSNGTLQKGQYVPLYTLSRAQLADGPFQLASRERRFKSDAEVWKALAEDPHLVVTPSYQNPGMILTLAGPDGPVQFRVAGATKTLALWGLVGSEAAMAPFKTLPIGTTILAKTAPGADATAVVRQIEREVFSRGADTMTVKEIADSLSGGTQAVVEFMRLVMGMGLLVGVFSLGILALRAVIERRRSIGMLRALGYRPGQVLAGIVSEGLITTTCGALVGIGVGILISLVVMNVFRPGARLEIDASLALIVGLIYLSVLAVTIPPALRAARLPAVEALRLED